MRLKFISARRLTAVVGAGALVVGLASPAFAAPGPAAPAAARAAAPAAPAPTPAAPVGAGIGGFNAAILYNGQPQDFYWDTATNSLRHAWWTGTVWNFETLDGPDSDYPLTTGVTHDQVGTYSSVIVYAGQLHVWYEDITAGALRHGWFDPSTGWHFESLDGHLTTGGRGRTPDSVGQYTSVVLYQGLPHVWYYDQTAFTLRHAWWTGSAWSFETLDGPGAGAPANGRTADHVGQFTAVTLYQNLPHVWYRDGSFGSLRHAWWTGLAWDFETLDGPFAQGGATNGRVTSDAVGTNPAVTLYQGQPHVWYSDDTKGALRHGWYDGTTWRFETLDGAGGANARTTDHVGTDSAVTLYQGQPHVWYADNTAGTLRHAWWTGAAWDFESLDGPGVSGDRGRTGDTVGSDNAVILYQGQPHVWYLDYSASAHTLRHAWWSGTSWTFETLDGNVVAAAPVVTGLNPTSGTASGNTGVAIEGRGFTGTTSVTFGGVATASFNVLSDFVIVAPSPPGTGVVDVRVTNPMGTSPVARPNDQFTYVPVTPAPAVTAVTPATGPTTGATNVTITGTAFTGATAVNFGTVAATAFAVVSATQMTATSPAAPAGVVDVTVVTPAGTSAVVAADHFTYTAVP